MTRTRQDPKDQEGGSDPLAAGVCVLLGGGDPIPTALESLRQAVGARCAVWSEGPGRLRVALEGRPDVHQELPGDVPGRWLDLDQPEGRRRVCSAELSRDPRARAAGLLDALVQRSSHGLLWLDARSPLQLSSRDTRALLSALDRLCVLRDQQHQLRSSGSLAARGERAAGVAHDLRNQLSLALLELERLRADGVTDEHLAAALERARAISEEFLSPSATSASSGLGEWLASEASAAARLAGRGDEVRVLVRSLAPENARSEEHSFRRVVMNLTLNAIHATPRGGCVRVELRAEAGFLQLAIQDEGRGMSSSELEELFRPGATRGGTGFGTTSVQDCVASLAGEISVTSAPGEGTRVEVRWPAS